jgi:hypothetical protein
MAPKWSALNSPDYSPAFKVGEQAVLVTQVSGKLQATVVEVQSLLDPDRHGRTVYTGRTLDANVVPKGTITKFTSENAVKPVT